ncbi:alpha/beta hydrolase [Phytohabitans sp. ZYX-F-186]|uniref:Alpha/beta hydrolase n=1 Tax=Phytohabitans maris TaxID=3071409 RepID=A0ABU0ZIY6_9ACTN|nr:alpha/beta hydrolase [Phytohabitans sp. ZYX-F-186]MDQ7907009.1 alpha/beta hydrolase [Phytohabitans sp. ZYX-F-186]
MTTSYLDRGEGRIAYEVAGEGPLVVCVPGMGDLRSAFRFTVPALLGAGYRVAAMDLRGHGESDDGFTAYDDPALASDIRALVAHLGGPALLIGNSMGAASSIIAAAEQPELVAGLALMGPWVRDPKPNPVMRLVQRVMLVKPWGPAAWRAFYKTLYPGRRPDDLASHVDRIGAAMRRGDHWRSFARTTTTSHAPVEARLDDVRAPALVVMGEKDPDFPDPAAEARFAAERLHGELLMVPDSGHYPQADSPDVVNPAVLTFAAKVFG